MATILIADDEGGNRQLPSTLLRCDGHHVRAVANGTAVVERVQANSPHFALSDGTGTSIEVCDV